MHNIRPHDSTWKKLDFFFNKMLLRNAVLIRALHPIMQKKRFYKVPKERIVTFMRVAFLLMKSQKQKFFRQKYYCKRKAKLSAIGQIRRYK